MLSSKLSRWAAPAPAWVAAFIVCVAADALLGRWVLFPNFVVGFYGGMLIMASLIYPRLQRWRLWLRPRGVRAWFLVEVVLWVGIAGGLVLSAPWWLEWSWGGWLPLQASGALLLILSIGAGAWALGTMGWSRLLLAGAMFPSGAGAEENHVPQLLVVKGPYRYVRNPIYVLDVGVLFGTALLTSNWWLVILTVAYVIQLRTQVHAEERELKARFGVTYDRYCRQVPRFIPRLRPVDPAAVYRSPELAFTLAKGAVPLILPAAFEPARKLFSGVVVEDVYIELALPAQARGSEVRTPDEAHGRKVRVVAVDKVELSVQRMT